MNRIAFCLPTGLVVMLLAGLAVSWPLPRCQAQADPRVLQLEAQRVSVVARASAAAVAIFSPNGQGGGSGVVISPDGYALSNFHVTDACGTAMKCGLSDGKLYDAVIVGLDPTGDVALVKMLGRDDFPTAELGDSDRVEQGDWCFTIGNPFLLATDFTPSVAYGVVSGTHRYQYPAGTFLEYTDCIQVDAAINPGNSGGPLFDAEGRLIGINGRGSFEKRGRVNVGVGYAISINQIKMFLGHLRAGRMVDHATLGARVTTGGDRRVVVDDILENSDAFRRGLRYGDEIVRLAGRGIHSANAVKNLLGIFPKGWRIPVVYRRDGQEAEIWVRLRGLHSEAELAAMISGERQQRGRRSDRPPGKPQPNPRQPAPDRPGEKPQREPAPGGEPPETPERPHPLIPGLPAPAIPLPEIVRQHYQQRPGYVNYRFNEVQRERVWRAFLTHGDFAGTDVWHLRGELAAGGDVSIELGQQSVRYRTAGGELKLDWQGDLSERLEPARSGGLLVALAAWRRLVQLGPRQFGETTYLGTLPLAEQTGLFDVLTTIDAGVEIRFFFREQDGELAGLEMYPDDEADPCELYFRDYRGVDGRQMPHIIDIRYGDAVYQIINLRDIRLAEPREA